MPRGQEDFIILKGKKRIATVALLLRNDNFIYLPIKNTGSAVKQSLYFYLSLSSFISSSAYLQHCSTKRLKEMLSAAATRLSLSKSCSVKRTVRGILAFFISLSILNITITFMDIITYLRLCFYNRFWLQKRCLKVI